MFGPDRMYEERCPGGLMHTTLHRATLGRAAKAASRANQRYRRTTAHISLGRNGSVEWAQMRRMCSFSHKHFSLLGVFSSSPLFLPSWRGPVVEGAVVVLYPAPRPSDVAVVDIVSTHAN